MNLDGNSTSAFSRMAYWMALAKYGSKTNPPISDSSITEMPLVWDNSSHYKHQIPTTNNYHASHIKTISNQSNPMISLGGWEDLTLMGLNHFPNKKIKLLS